MNSPVCKFSRAFKIVPFIVDRADVSNEQQGLRLYLQKLFCPQDLDQNSLRNGGKIHKSYHHVGYQCVV